MRGDIPTIYATERIRTAQDLLHQLDSIRKQASILTGKEFVQPSEVRGSLWQVLAEEIEKQERQSNGS